MIADDFLTPGFISMSPGFSSICVFRILLVLIQIVIIQLHRATHQLKAFATIMEKLILILTECKDIFITKRQSSKQTFLFSVTLRYYL